MKTDYSKYFGWLILLGLNTNIVCNVRITTDLVLPTVCE